MKRVVTARISPSVAKRPSRQNAVQLPKHSAIRLASTRTHGHDLGVPGELDQRGASLRVLNLGGGDINTSTPMGAMVFTVMAALAQMELDINRERITADPPMIIALAEASGNANRALWMEMLRSAGFRLTASYPKTMWSAITACPDVANQRECSESLFLDELRPRSGGPTSCHMGDTQLAKPCSSATKQR
jgi:hypothetical protein